MKIIFTLTANTLRIKEIMIEGTRGVRMDKNGGNYRPLSQIKEKIMDIVKQARKE